MKQPAYLVRFATLSADFDRVRNFAEDLHRALLRQSLGTVPNEATAIDEVHVHIPSSRNLGQGLKHIHELLRQHMLNDSAVVVRNPEDD
jgi:hypothetical protein